VNGIAAAPRELPARPQRVREALDDGRELLGGDLARLHPQHVAVGETMASVGQAFTAYSRQVRNCRSLSTG
jgi:hypothetical protein